MIIRLGLVRIFSDPQESTGDRCRVAPRGLFSYTGKGGGLPEGLDPLPDSSSESLLLPGAPFRGLQRVEFLFFLGDSFLEVSGEIAGPTVPLRGGFRDYRAKGALVKFFCPGATLALLDDRVAPAAVEIATFSGHERTLGALLHGYALHGSFLLGDAGKEYFDPVPL